MRILIAEDDMIFRQALERTLNKMGRDFLSKLMPESNPLRINNFQQSKIFSRKQLIFR